MIDTLKTEKMAKFCIQDFQIYFKKCTSYSSYISIKSDVFWQTALEQQVFS